jgi:site-specific recombinase XerC
MSKKSDFEHELKKLSANLGGSHLTRQARDGAIMRFASHIWDAGFQLKSTDQIKLKHIKHFVESRKSAGISARTLQNDVSNIRRMLVGAGREQFVREQLGSSQLGLEKGSRIGTKRAIDDETLNIVLSKVKKIDAGVYASLMLARHLGLRSAEAVRAASSLKQWESAIVNGGHIVVSAGTKGGRTRVLPVALLPDKVAALVAIRTALTENGKGNIVEGVNLKQALNRYHNVCRSAGLTGECAPHSLRYRFAVETLSLLQKAAFSSAESLMITSEVLGHGDGRGRWVKMVYGRT